MTAGTRTWGLVVGIDTYDDPGIPALTGAANDAVTAVGWLRALGVPDDQILLHTSPGDAARPAVEALGLPHHEGDLRSIWSSVETLADNGGDRLFVFLSGHGFYEPTKGRLFLTQDARQRRMTNLGIELWIAYLRSLPYRSQFLLMDGCQNYPYSPSQRMKVDAALYPGVAEPTPLPENSLVAFFAASQGEVAPEIAGRGAYLRRFFEFTDPDHPLEESTALDFSTGRRSVLARSAHLRVAEAVTSDAASLRPRITLNPSWQPYGRAASVDDVPLFDLPATPTSRIAVTVRPSQAADGVRRLRLRCLRPPYWERRLPLPPATVVPLPVDNLLPRGLELAIDLDLVSGTLWANAVVEVRFSTDVDRQVDIDLDDLISRLPSTGENEQGAVLLTVDPQGRTTYNAIPPRVYDDLGRQARDASSGEEPVTLNRHESGPDLVLPAARAISSWLVESLAQRILRETPANIGVTTAIGGRTPDTTAIHITVSPGQAARLAGPLRAHPTVAVRSPGEIHDVVWRGSVRGAERGYSLEQLIANPFLGVSPGAHQITLDLPWGSWSRVVDVPRDGVVSVVLPERVGRPPLRAELADSWPYRPGVTVLGNTLPSVAVLSDERRGRERPLTRPPQGRGAQPDRSWLMPAGQRPQGQRLIRLSWPDGPDLHFPARLDGVLGVELADGQARVEPLVHFAQPLWDLLVTTGRLDALTPVEAHELSYGKWEDPLLGLAAAYALQSSHPDLLPTVIGNLRRLGMTDPDLVLLELAHPQGGLTDPETTEHALQRLASDLAVPSLRWGIPMARLLVASTSADLSSWDSLLAQIEDSLSPASVWTVWTQ